jgi:hypothetical protein
MWVPTWGSSRVDVGLGGTVEGHPGSILTPPSWFRRLGSLRGGVSGPFPGQQLESTIRP